MARKLRINEIAYYHVVSRGNHKADVFFQKEDYIKFLELLNKIQKDYKINVHCFCLMKNHYHLLIQTTKKNISEAIKFLNHNYALYFNLKYDKIGHLWQARFFSSILYDDEHVLNVAKYIERNPIAASIVNTIEEYTYQSYFYIKNKNKCILFDMNIKEYESLIYSEFQEDTKELIYNTPKIVIKNKEKKILYKRLKSFFEEDNDINRNENIKKAYEYGYTKKEISNYLNISDSRVSQITS